jgi:hypothetical protein
MSNVELEDAMAFMECVADEISSKTPLGNYLDRLHLQYHQALFRQSLVEALKGVNAAYEAVACGEENDWETFDDSYDYDFIPQILTYTYEQLGQVVDISNEDWIRLAKALYPRPIWRADVGKNYFIVSIQLHVINRVDNRCSLDNTLYKNGNYFRTRTLAEAAAEKVREVFKNADH